jgi:hypothetical protein
MVKGLNQHCQCDYRVGQITNAGWRCFPQSPTAVTFRADISDQLQATEYETDFLETWVSSGVVVLVQAQILSVNRHCKTIISSFSEEECRAEVTPTSGENDIVISTLSEETEVASGDNTTLQISGAVIASVLVTLVVSLAILVLSICYWKRSRKKTELPPRPG